MLNMASKNKLPLLSYQMKAVTSCILIWNTKEFAVVIGTIGILSNSCCGTARVTVSNCCIQRMQKSLSSHKEDCITDHLMIRQSTKK